MVRMLEFKCSIVSGDDMRDALKAFPQLKDNFEQRKSFDEYYFSKMEVEISIDQLEKLQWLFDIEISGNRIILSS